MLALKLFDPEQPATRVDVEVAIAAWRAHSPECSCGLCGRARKVSVSHVWMCLWAWDQSIARTRRLARR